MSAIKYGPLIIGILLALSVAVYSNNIAVQSNKPNTVLRVAYPDSLDESDVTNIYGYQNVLAQEGITVIPTYFDSTTLAYLALISGQADIAQVAPGVMWKGILNGGQVTCLGGDILSASFIMITGAGMTQASQLLGKTVEDAGPGTETRALDFYNFNQSGVPTNTAGPNPNSVYLKASGGNSVRVHDLEAGLTGGIYVDSFILPDISNPSVNNSAHGGPFHVLFPPATSQIICHALVTVSWLNNPANQKIIVQYLKALFIAERYFVSNPTQAVPYMASQLPETPQSELTFSSMYYPTHLTYSPWGIFNFQGQYSIQNLFAETNTLLVGAGQIPRPVANDSIQPWGVANKWFEYQALQQLGPYDFPCTPYLNSGYLTPSYISTLQQIVPSSLGGVASDCSSV